ncbi:MAG: uracil-DNA glycosylase family protein [Candidatus Micrarchaeaceae archaeon]
MPQKPKVLFIGINPHYGSYHNGVPFSNNKSFWYLLSRSGLISENIETLRNNKSLKKFYLNEFGKKYCYGFVNLIDRPTRSVSELRKGEETAGVKKVRRLLLAEKPSIACFVGKITYQKFSGLKNVKFGLQPYKIGRCRIFVSRFPIRGPSSIRINEFRFIGRIIKSHSRSAI